MHEAALAFENRLAPDGSPLPTIQEGQHEDNYDDDYLNYYANYFTKSHDASESIIPSIAALENGQYVAAEGEVHSNYMTRAFELERQALEARSSFEFCRTELLALADRQGPEQADGEGLFGDHPVASAASDDQIDSTTLEQHLLLFDYLAEPVTGAADGHLHHHSVWMTENGTSCVSDGTRRLKWLNPTEKRTHLDSPLLFLL